MVSKAYVEFFSKSYRDGKLVLDGLTPIQQDKLRQKAGTYLSRTKDQMIQDMDDLTNLIPMLPEKHLIKVLTPERIDKLASALLTVSTVDLRPRIENGKPVNIKKLIKERGAGLQALIKRQYEIAALLMEKGAIKCLRAFEEIEQESPLYRMVENETLRAVHLLKYVATKQQGVAGDYRFNADRYAVPPSCKHPTLQRIDATHQRCIDCGVVVKPKKRVHTSRE